MTSNDKPSSIPEVIGALKSEIFVKELDVQLVEKIKRSLKLDPASPKFDYGQIRRSAGLVVRHCGHEWAFKIPLIREPIETRRLRRLIRAAVEQSVVAQNKSPIGLWRQFRNHAIQIGARLEAKKVLANVARIS